MDTRGSYPFQDLNHDHRGDRHGRQHLGGNHDDHHLEGQSQSHLQNANDQAVALQADLDVDHATEPAEPNSNLSKDEVAWYFVEQYYTTLSKGPEKLHLFYSKRSQFVCGMEAEITNVSIGRQDIQERISQLDFSECKVRVSNVDSQASFDNIVIQVIGEKSLKGAESRKFVQTFVLAPQFSGYFVLNDILRYIDDEDEQPAQAAPPAAQIISTVKETLDLNNAEDQLSDQVETREVTVAEPLAQEPLTLELLALDPLALDPRAVDPRPVERSDSMPLSEEIEADAPANFDPEPVFDIEPANQADSDHTAELIKTPESSTPPTFSSVLAPSDESPPKAPDSPTDKESPKLKEAEHQAPEVEKAVALPPTPVSRPTTAPEPAKPMTWASKAAAAAGNIRSISVSAKTSASPTTPQSKPPMSLPNPAAPIALDLTEALAPPIDQLSTAHNEWQTSGSRQYRQQSISDSMQMDNNTLAYVKGVSDRVKVEVLRKVLEGFGEITYFDISRPKQCAFVEYTHPSGLQNAKAASPMLVNGEQIDIEDRRPKANAYGGSNYTGRGNPSSRGRGSWDNGRDSAIRIGSLSNYRGGSFQPRGRGIVRGRGNMWVTRKLNDDDAD